MKKGQTTYWTLRAPCPTFPVERQIADAFRQDQTISVDRLCILERTIWQKRSQIYEESSGRIYGVVGDSLNRLTDSLRRQR
jgi:hypothetical protein